MKNKNQKKQRIQRNQQNITLIILLLVQRSYQGNEEIKLKDSLQIENIRTFYMRDLTSLYVLSGFTLKVVNFGLRAPGGDDTVLDLSTPPAEEKLEKYLKTGDPYENSVMTLHKSKFIVFDMVDDKNIITYYGQLSKSQKNHNEYKIFDEKSHLAIHSKKPFTVTMNPWKADNNRILVLERVFSMVVDGFGQVDRFQQVEGISHCAEGLELIFPHLSHQEAKKLTTKYFFVKCGATISTYDSMNYKIIVGRGVGEANRMEKSRVALIGTKYDRLIIPSFLNNYNHFRVAKEDEGSDGKFMGFSNSLTLNNHANHNYRNVLCYEI